MNHDFKPVIFGEEGLGEFKNTHENYNFVDALEEQIKDLYYIAYSKILPQEKKEALVFPEFAPFRENLLNDYCYIYFSWNNTLIKSVTKDNYLKLKTNRNKDLITEDEQKILREYKVAVLGMSVGSNIAFVLTQAGISNEITLADFDELDTTNLNRILAGVHQIGLNKTIVAARRIYEDNPFAEINTMPNGVDMENLNELLAKGEVNCIFDEVDAMPIKIGIRKLAMQYKVPVLMLTDNGDGIVIHVERYDLGHDKIFHKEEGYWLQKMEEVKQAGPNAKAVIGQIIMNDIVGGMDKVDPKMLASVKKTLDKELVSWSQLGSAAILAGVYGTYAVKQIALKKDERLDIRSYVYPNY